MAQYIDFAKKETSLQLQGIVNIRKQPAYKLRTIVSEVSSFVGNPVSYYVVCKI